VAVALALAVALAVAVAVAVALALVLPPDPGVMTKVSNERAGTVAVKVPPLTAMADCLTASLLAFVRTGVAVPLATPVPVSA
jgi:hypothetical protein